MIEESHSLLSDADISYDKTEEDLDMDRSYLRSGREWKRSYDKQLDQEHHRDHHDNKENTPDKKKRRSVSIYC